MLVMPFSQLFSILSAILLSVSDGGLALLSLHCGYFALWLPVWQGTVTVFRLTITHVNRS